MDKYTLITRNLQEVHGKDVLKKIIDKRNLNLYWGTAPTGKIHLGYFVPMLKIADFIKAECNVTILLADLHAYLDNMKSTLKSVEYKSMYYKEIIISMLELLNVDVSKVNFVTGTDYQLTPAYTLDVYRLYSRLGVNEAKHSGAEVVKQSDNPKVTGLLYPGLQVLDEVHITRKVNDTIEYGVDAQFGGIDQRKIFMMGREHLPKMKKNPHNDKLKYNKKIHLMNKLVPGLSNVKQDNTIDNKMSASNEQSKIDLLDGNKQIKKKINSAYCLPGDTKDNSLMVILEEVIFKIMEHRDETFDVTIRNKDTSETIDKSYNNINDVKEDFKTELLYPNDFKLAISKYLIDLIKPIREKMNTKEMKMIIKQSYN